MIHQGKTPSRTGRFSRRDRLLKRYQFEELQESGRKLYTKFFLVSVSKRTEGPSRLGVTITKRVAPNATERNRVKRRAREFFRRYRSRLSQPLDIVIIARREAQHCSFTEMCEALFAALCKHGYATP
ncbi:MAG: ribonuclease P protein component [Proteobacteria bacterium]|nr:ribonuclease P protein component [Pseudomonadota bacterium]